MASNEYFMFVVRLFDTVTDTSTNDYDARSLKKSTATK